MFHDPQFWVAISFIGFIALLYKPIRRALLNGLDGRTARIAHELDEASRLKAEAEALLSSYQRQRQEATEEAKQILQDAENEAVAITKKAQADLEEAIARRTELAIQKMAAYEAALLHEIRDQAIDLTTQTVRRLVSAHLSPSMAKELVAKSVADVNKKLN